MTDQTPAQTTPNLEGAAPEPSYEKGGWWQGPADFAAYWNVLSDDGRQALFDRFTDHKDLADAARERIRMEQTPGIRPWIDLQTSSVLWMVNRQVFHPIGYALALHLAGDRVIGWSLQGDGSEPMTFGGDGSNERVDLQNFFTTLARQRAQHAAQVRQAWIDTLTEEEQHRHRVHPDYEYTVTESARKGDSNPPAGEGWEPNPIFPVYDHPQDGGEPQIVNWRNWERFDHTEEEHWRRLRSISDAERAEKAPEEPRGE